MRGADAKIPYPTCPIRLITDLRNDHLRSARKRRGRRRSRTAVMNHRGDSRKQCVMIDIADDEAIVAIIDQGQLCPSAGQKNASAMRAHHVDSDPGEIFRRVQTAETDVDRWLACFEKRGEIRRQSAIITEHPCACLHDVGHCSRTPRPKHWIGGE